MRKSFLIPPCIEHKDGVIRLDVEYREDDKKYYFGMLNDDGQFIESFTGKPTAGGEAAYIAVVGLKVLYDANTNCVLYAETDLDADRAVIRHRAANGKMFYSIDPTKVDKVYMTIEDSPEEVFESRRLKNSSPVTEVDVANVKNLSDEEWINALKEHKQPR